MTRYQMSYAALAAAGIAALTTTGAARASYGFQGLGFLADGYSSYAYSVNADGTVIGGQSDYTLGLYGFVWQSGTMLPRAGIGGQSAAVLGISANGSTAVGYSGSQGIAWRNFTGSPTTQPLGYLSTTGTHQSGARSVSADGSTAAGFSTVDAGYYQATIFSNTNAGTITRTNLGAITPGARSEAFAISANASVVVGESNAIGGQQAFRWNSADLMVGLGDLSGGSTNSSARAASADGSVIVGYGTTAAGQQAMRWVKDGGPNGGGTMTSLGSFDYAVALGVSGDGSIIVGEYYDENFSLVAFLWTADLGMVNLQQYLADQGVAGLDSWTLHSATAISADGTTIVGYGFDAFYQEEAFRVDISSLLVPAPPTATLVSIAGFVATRRRRRSGGARGQN